MYYPAYQSMLHKYTTLQRLGQASKCPIASYMLAVECINKLKLL